MNPTSQSSQMLRVTGLWASTSKSGRKMLSGQVSPGLRLIVMENPRATGNQPPFEAFLAPSEKREQQASQPSQELF